MENDYMRVKGVCFNCGYIALDDTLNCEACGNLFTKVSIIEGIKHVNMNGEQRIKWIENKLGHSLKKEELTKRDRYCKNQMQEFNQRKEAEQTKLKEEQEAKLKTMTQKVLDKVNNVPKCPICGSTNINKITLTTRAVKTAAFGVVGAVDDAGKTWKCGNCGSRF